MSSETRTGRRWSAPLAAAGLVLWGLIHIAGGISLLVADTADGLQTLGPNAADTVPAAPGRAAASLLRFHGLNIAFAGAAVLGLALAWWRYRSRWPLDVAIATAAALDVGLIMVLVAPGVLPATQGLIGPLLVIVAFIGAIGARGTATARTAA
jgi:hypothetical protein